MAAYGVFDLVLSADLPFTQTFTFTDNGLAGDWTAYTPRLQVRHPWTGELLIELTAFLTPGADATRLNLVIPASMTAKLPAEGRWDVLALHKTDANRAVRMPATPGRILVKGGVTQRA